MEQETLRVGVEGKAAGWATLRLLADHHPRLDRERLDRLLDGARQQSRMLEELRIRTVTEVFGATSTSQACKSRRV